MGKKYFVLFALLVLSISACGEGDNAKLQAPIGGATTLVLKDWSGLGVNTVTSGSVTTAVNHGDYLAGSHSAYQCADCHAMTAINPATGTGATVTRDQICVTCHPFSRYTSVMTNANHTTLATGTRCNACHYSASGATGSGISGWRWSSVATPKTRISHTLWHGNVQGTAKYLGTAKCLDCHTAANETIPASHPAGATTQECSNCHYYSNGRWAGQHVQVTTGCRSCHNNHYNPYNCEWCHTGSASSGYASWALSFSKHSHQNQFDSRSCGACHNGGFGGDG